MYPARTYDLGFIPKRISKSGKPEITIAIQLACWAEFTKTLGEVVEWNKALANEYLKNTRNTSFVLPHLGNGHEYGHSSCCRVERTSGAVTIHFELCRPKYLHSVLTMSSTLEALNRMLYANTLTEAGGEEQYLRIESGCNACAPHGHAIFGEVFPVFGRWLQRRVEQKNEIISPREAMREVWSVVVDRNLRQYVEYCSFHIEKDGRFFFGCFGDACDLAIYPDQASYRDLSEMRVSFSSHNLDTPCQQLTLLSGIASLAMLAREERPS